MAGLLEGRVAVVTGGGGGIGRGISERFAAEGARVVVADIDGGRARETVGAIRASGGDATAAVVDVREPGDVEALFATTDRAYGPVTVLVNNVGHYGGRRGDFHLQTRDDWTALYRVNLEHVLLCTHAALARMLGAERRPEGGASIVNVSTVEAFRAIPTRAVYSACKAAITGLTRSLGVEYAGRGIRVNAIAPDVTETLQVPYSQWLTDDDRAMIPTWVPVGRLGTPDDVASVALFLASDLAAFVTGTTVHVDGGTYAAGGWFPTAEGHWTNRPRHP
jgi:NAD(P)-dependent dehydrogenase (short-subunit alcohol dehydrogenase family)